MTILAISLLVFGLAMLAMSVGVLFGRAPIREDLVKRMRAGEIDASRCVARNQCMVEMERGGTRCVERATRGEGAL